MMVPCSAAAPITRVVSPCKNNGQRGRKWSVNWEVNDAALAIWRHDGVELEDESGHERQEWL